MMGRKSKLKKERKVEKKDVNVQVKEPVKAKKDYFRTGLLVVEGIVSLGLLLLIFNKGLIEANSTRTLMWWVYLITQVATGLFMFKKSEGKYKSIYHWEFTLVTVAYIIFSAIG